MRCRPKLVVALDVNDAEVARRAAAQLRGHVDLLKIGLELFVSCGADFLSELAGEGWRIFLDLKLHDIPATVAGAVRAAKGLGVEMLTLHASGGTRMLEAAVDARDDEARPMLLGVTVLTSLDHADLERLGQRDSPERVVERLAAMVHRCGCDGVVASAHEAAAVKGQCGPEFLVVTPGIRPAGAALDDQSRVATVETAVAAGADFLVVGRPILRATDPAQAAAEIQSQIESAYVRDQ